MTAREHTEPGALRGLAHALSRHWTDGAITFVRNFTNLVYHMPDARGGSLYLRLSPEAHRSGTQIASELELIAHLAASGVPVSEAVVSRDGLLVHDDVTTGGRWSACAFAAAPGSSWPGEPPADAAVCLHEAGRTMGRLHRAIDSFVPSAEFRRFHWTMDRWSRFASGVPEKETEAWTLFRELRRWIDSLPLETPQFGLIHGDFTVANFRMHCGTITLFDFDSCCAHWRAYELATFLHYFGGRDPGGRALAWNRVLDGYAAEHALPDPVVAAIPRFGLLRLLFSFLVFAEEWGFENLTPEQEAYFALRRRLFGAGPIWPGTRRL